MRSVLHTMKYEVPFEHERLGGFRNLTNSATPSADGPTLSPFCMPPVDAGLNITVQALVRVDRSGRVIERHVIEVPFLVMATTGNRAIAYNPQKLDVLAYFEAKGDDLPCGLYYYECYFSVAGGDPTPQQYRYKTEIFKIDKAPVPTERGDFSPFDFNTDFNTAG